MRPKIVKRGVLEVRCIVGFCLGKIIGQRGRGADSEGGFERKS